MYHINKTTMNIWVGTVILLVLSLLVLIAGYEYETQVYEQDLKRVIKAHNEIAQELRMANHELADYRNGDSILVNQIEETIRRMNHE